MTNTLWVYIMKTYFEIQNKVSHYGTNKKMNILLQYELLSCHFVSEFWINYSKNMRNESALTKGIKL